MRESSCTYSAHRWLQAKVCRLDGSQHCGAHGLSRCVWVHKSSPAPSTMGGDLWWLVARTTGGLSRQILPRT